MPGIDDIIIRKKKDSGSQIINKYREPKIIAENILADFIKKFDEGRGFPLDDKTERYGLISNCMALSSFLELASLGASLKEYERQFCLLIEMIFSTIDSEAKGYNATPYIERRIVDYTETVSKVLICATDLRSYLFDNEIDDFYGIKIGAGVKKKEIRSNEQLIEQCERVMLTCMNKLSDSCIETSVKRDFKIDETIVERKGVASSVISHRGWTYAKIDQTKHSEYGTSIYYTYHATNAFLSLYQTFNGQFDQYYEREGGEITTPVDLSEKAANVFKKNTQFFYDNFPDIERFRNMVIESGRYVETKLADNNVNLALDYIDYNFNPISYDEIVRSRTSNDAINTLFILSILINCGIDDDYLSVGQKDFFYEQMQFSLSNVKKMFSILKGENREDVIDSYKIVFEEKTPKEEKANIQEFRKLCSSVGVMDLVPLFCNTYSIVSEYLIKYPQKEMIDNLSMIMENRMSSSDWIWSKEGFNVNNNLYYVFALENFYDYYNKYENPLAGSEEKYNVRAQKAEKARDDAEREKRNLQIEYEKLVIEKDNKKSELDKEVYKIAEEMFAKKIEGAIEGYFAEMIDDAKKLVLHVSKEQRRSAHYSPGDSLFEQYPKAKLLFQMALAENFALYTKEFTETNKEQSAIEKELDEKIDSKIFEKIK